MLTVVNSSLGIDYGTNSVRALIVDCANGRELGCGIFEYPSGHQGVLQDRRNHHLARQNPADYLLGLEECVRAAIAQAKLGGFRPESVAGIGLDATGSSPLPVDAGNKALGMDSRWRENLDAQCWLWKDHTAHEEAVAITSMATRHRPHFIAKCGNMYSSEWFWSKIWHCLKVAPEVFEAADSWVELADWIPSVLAGVTIPDQIKRGICMAGHKALYSNEWGGLPDREFLALLDSRLAELRDRLYDVAHDASVAAGHLCPEWAARLGLPAGIPIAIGEMDVHYGAIGCGVSEGTLIKVMGTSTCDCGVVSAEKPVADIPGICGIVKGSILPGFHGVEAGQSAVGDIFKWWVEVVCLGDHTLHQKLTAEAETLKPGESGLLALDWNNGNRTILVDPMLTGLLIGQTLYTTRTEIYRALIEATAFGARAIIERLREYGMPIERVVCAGGIAEKNPLAMQIYADITGCKIQISGSSQACALGAAISAAVLAGIHSDFPSAQAVMTSLKDTMYDPNLKNRQVYGDLYLLYRKLHDAFGGVTKHADLFDVMKRLHAIKDRSL